MSKKFRNSPTGQEWASIGKSQDKWQRLQSENEGLVKEIADLKKQLVEKEVKMNSEPKLVTDWKAMCRDRDKDINRLDKSLTDLKKKVSDIFEDNCKLEKQIVAEQSRSAKLLEVLKDEVKFIKEVLGTEASDKSYELIADAEKGE